MPKSGTELINEARSRVTEVRARDAVQIHARGEDVVWLDVRERNEWNLGRIPGATHIARGNLETTVEQTIPRSSQVIVYCASGSRSALAADTMRQMGYEKVASLAGGWREWVGAGGDVED
ncbi:MAG TPA: rhodanese-like domain-containing protein [Gemmatimonadaceae bacterium]|nr:rhodanese-like domain-containing protein [Gemmatimonadaceae bacterium]